jgi:hypothetical protein
MFFVVVELNQEMSIEKQEEETPRETKRHAKNDQDTRHKMNHMHRWNHNKAFTATIALQ